MPLSKEQVGGLKDPMSIVEVQQENPKKPGTKSFERFNQYKRAKTIGEATACGAWQDLSGDFEKGFLKLVDPETDEEMPASTKRSAPEGTRDREAQTRSKMQPNQGNSQILVPETSDPISKVEMSAATIAALRAMMREEIRAGMLEVEERMATKCDEAIRNMQQDIAEEREARKVLEERVKVLEANQATTTENMMEGEDQVDKSVVVIGGFGEDTLEEVEGILQQVLQDVAGFEEVKLTASGFNIALATFDSPMHALSFVRSQKRNKPFQERKFLGTGKHVKIREVCQLQVVQDERAQKR